ncbi:restriction endonuclease subunit S [Verrucosispora sp. FIM060022]|uniref:restriction endonuclease subunit S n=1 Tax=Verrucosispora sp. FIM060022 TaxID=1479020 RepID=UPI000F860B27|nr:restriction endonuclease subunit S [Verrucosispora sp. FIM060022]RUL93710.1 restriction endonuclease subunit S [Verrucosispora sp. FIM060022]
MSLLDLEAESIRAWGRVRDFFEVTRKPRALDFQEDVIPFAPMETVPQNHYRDPAYETRPWDGRGGGTYFERGDLLVAKITPSFENGKQATTNELHTPFGFATTEVIPLKPISPGSTDRRLLFFFLLHPEVRRFAANRMEGTTGRQRISEQTLLDLPYPIFDAEEQRRISDVLVGIYESIDAETEAERAALALRRALHHELFGDAADSTLRKGWVREDLGQRCTVSSGGTPARGVDAYWVGGTIPWVKTAEVNYGVITRTEEHITEEGLECSAAKMLPPSTLLLAMYGQGVTRGRVAMLGVEATSNQACAAIQPDAEVVLPKFLFHYLMAHYDFIRSRAHGGQQQNLNLDLVRGLPIAYPADLEEQRRIVAGLDAIGELAELHAQKQRTLRGLFVSLLHGLLTGEIEPASLGTWIAPERLLAVGGRR